MLARFKSPLPISSIKGDAAIWVPRLAAAVGLERGTVTGRHPMQEGDDNGDTVSVLFHDYGAECVNIPASVLDLVE